MNRAERRLAEKYKRRQPARHRPAIINTDHLRLALTPWKIAAVFAPIERVIAQIENNGTVDAARGVPVFRETHNGGWYEIVAALDGVIDYHRRAAEYKTLVVNLAPLERLRNKLKNDSPIFPDELSAAQSCIDQLKRFAGALTQGEANDLLHTARIAWEFEAIGMTGNQNE